MSQQYADYEKLVAEIVGRYSRKFRIDREELESEAYLIFVESQASFDSSRAVFSTWLTHNLEQGLFNFIRKFWVNPTAMQECSENSRGATWDPSTSGVALDPSSITEFKSILESLSGSAQEVVDILFNSPGKVQGRGREFNRRRVRNNLQIVLRNEGWALRKIQRTFKEIQAAL
jgi:hypothetical protein